MLASTDQLLDVLPGLDSKLLLEKAMSRDGLAEFEWHILESASDSKRQWGGGCRPDIAMLYPDAASGI